MSAKGASSSDDNILGEPVNNLVEGNKVFDRYTLMKLVGRSRCSAVWKAWDERLGRDVALKFLPAMVRPDASALVNLKSEIKKLQEIKHPQLVNIDNVENEGPLVAIVQDYVDGYTLSALREAKSDQVFSPAEFSDWLQQVCAALAHGQEQAMTPHGAIKTSNILVDQRGVVKVTDFGLERPVQEFLAKTTDAKDGGIELQYVSPQMAQGEPVTVLDDIYAIGATVYELLTSKPPFYTGDLMLQLQQKMPPPMTHRRKELRVIGEPIPRIWEQGIAACLAKDPAQRPQSIDQLVELLELKKAEAVPPVDILPAKPAAQSSKPVGIAIIVVVLLVAAVAAVMLGKKPAPPVIASGGTNQPGLSESALKEFEEKKRQAELNQKAAEQKLAEAQKAAKVAELAAQRTLEQAKRDAERVKLEEAKRLADAKKAQEQADARVKEAEAEAARIKAEAEKARQLAAANQSDDSKKALAELEAKLKKAEADKKMIQESANKQLEVEKARLAAEAKASQEDAAKRQAMILAAQAQARQADEERKRREAMLLDQQKKDREMLVAAAAKKAAEEAAMRKAADEKAKQEEAKRAAELMAQRQFSPDKKTWYNSLGMKFVAVGKTHFAVAETRRADFEAFFKAARYDAGKGWSNPGFNQAASHPVVNVNWKDAQAFCKWLTEKEQKEGIIGTRRYRLPTDAEWSEAVGLRGESGATPAEKDGRIKGAFPWGNAWPPSFGAGNYPDSLSYDSFDKTAPAGSFRPNALGIYDLGGNVWEWCEDASDATQKTRTLRGGSFLMNLPTSLFSSYRRHLPPDERVNDVGFRIVLAE